jgi:hypothetical protein
MKHVIPSVAFLLVTFAFTRCTPSRELQAEFVSAELVRIDTVERVNGQQLFLTWRCSNNITYVTQASTKSKFQLGNQMAMMVKR